MPKLLRLDWLTWALVAVVFAGMLWGIIAIQMSTVRQFRSEGRQARATLVDKSTTRSSSDTIEYNFSVTYMANGGNGEPSTFNAETGEVELGTIDVGTFSWARFTVGGQTYDKTEIGDKVDIYYLPSDTTKAELKSFVEEYNPVFLRTLVWILAAAAVFCLIAALFAPAKRPEPVTEQAVFVVKSE
ncbi:MAG: DUF3592 domain-containing protein [Ardenticatenaceae bacterium]|nr:DUF3592 domain-containing protein [Ardenticatenaceae bacterium]